MWLIHASQEQTYLLIKLEPKKWQQLKLVEVSSFVRRNAVMLSFRVFEKSSVVFILVFPEGPCWYITFHSGSGDLPRVQNCFLLYIQSLCDEHNIYSLFAFCHFFTCQIFLNCSAWRRQEDYLLPTLQINGIFKMPSVSNDRFCWNQRLQCVMTHKSLL